MSPIMQVDDSATLSPSISNMFSKAGYTAKKANCAAAGLSRCKEIIEYGQLTEIPMMPAFIRGVINLRGAVVPVIDLAARFGGHQTENSRRTCIAIILDIQKVLSVEEIGTLASVTGGVDTQLAPPQTRSAASG